MLVTKIRNKERFRIQKDTFKYEFILSNKMIIAEEVTVGERGQIVIPKNIRDLANIRPRQRLRIVSVNNDISLQPPQPKKSPEDIIFDALQKSHLSMKDWADLQKERDQDR